MATNINNDYSLKNKQVNREERRERVGVAATATFTFSSKPNEESHITLQDSAGNLKTFEIDDNADGTTGVGRVAVTGIASAGGGGPGTAIALRNAINSQSGFGITATTPSSGKVLLTQDTAGAAGNKSIIVDNEIHWNTTTSVNVPSTFSGGSHTRMATVAPFRVAINGAPNLRLQDNQNRYETFIGEQKL